MNIGLMDIDSTMANLALMKVSGYHKSIGDNVDWINFFDDYDKVYMSKIFNFTSEPQTYINSKEILKGGTGYDIGLKLPKEIDEFLIPDYSIYPKADYSVQFFSRGCIRNCPFCVVRKKEGYIYPVTPMNLNPKGKIIEVLDNSFFGNPEWKSAVKQILKWNQPIVLHGVDARIMTEEQAYNLNIMKHAGQIHIAWDNPKDKMEPKLREIIKYISPSKLMCYVLIGYWSTPEEDLYRVEKLRELNIDCFVMPYNKFDPYQKDFSRWANKKAVFKTVSWEDYNKTNKVGTNKDKNRRYT